MPSNHLILKTFTRTQSPELFEQVMRLRMQVFVDEQGVPPQNEQDIWDDVAMHWVFLDPIDPMPVATARLYGDHQKENTARIGRMAIRKPYRSQGIGTALMQSILEEASRQGFSQALCHAQTQALGFYRQLGFEAKGEEFLEEGIAHYQMVQTLPASITSG